MQAEDAAEALAVVRLVRMGAQERHVSRRRPSASRSNLKRNSCVMAIFSSTSCFHTASRPGRSSSRTLSIHVSAEWRDRGCREISHHMSLQ